MSFQTGKHCWLELDVSLATHSFSDASLPWIQDLLHSSLTFLKSTFIIQSRYTVNTAVFPISQIAVTDTLSYNEQSFKTEEIHEHYYKHQLKCPDLMNTLYMLFKACSNCTSYVLLLPFYRGGMLRFQEGRRPKTKSLFPPPSVRETPGILEGMKVTKPNWSRTASGYRLSRSLGLSPLTCPCAEEKPW